jgi:signal transduction histidine kinase
VLLAHRGLAETKGIKLETALDARLAEVWLFGDARRLQQCLNNGVSNAIKFTGRGRRVCIHAMLVAVKDGCASEAEHAEAARTLPVPSAHVRLSVIIVSASMRALIINVRLSVSSTRASGSTRPSSPCSVRASPSSRSAAASCRATAAPASA